MGAALPTCRASPAQRVMGPGPDSFSQGPLFMERHLQAAILARAQPLASNSTARVSAISIASPALKTELSLKAGWLGAMGPCMARRRPEAVPAAARCSG